MPTHWPGSLVDMDALYALARAARAARDRGRGARDRLAVEGTQHRRVRRPRDIQLPSEQEHDDDRGRRARRQRRRARRSASTRCASTASPTCPTARATSRFPAASSTCPTSTRGSASRQLARLPEFLATRRALVERYFERFATDPPCVLPPRPRAGDGQSWNMFSVLLPLDRLTLTRKAVPRRARRARHRHRRIVRGAAPVHAGPALRLHGRRLSEHRAHRARDRDAAAARRG